MDMTDSILTLVIKTTNQSVKDIKIECDLTWPVNRLKERISRTYPGNPPPAEQKLIYSGRLLIDSEILKDVLKHTYDAGQTTHTVHLLCKQKTPKVIPSSNHTSNTPTVSQNPINAQSEGLRHRSTSAVHQENPSQQSYGQYYSSTPVSQQGGNDMTLPAMLPGMPYSPEQMMWFQQLYAQQMAQYMQYMQNGVPGAEAVTTTAELNVGHAQHQVHAHAPAAAQGANRDQQMVINAAGGEAMFEDDEEANRDWLDRIYTLSRFGVLLIIVYFYSSVSRFFLVFGFFMLIWLYQSGYFRRRQGQVDVPEAEQQNQPAPAEEQQNQAPNTNVVIPEEVPADTPDQAETPVDTPAPEEPPVQDLSPSAAKVSFSFLVTFFTSLVPARPEPVNIN